MLTPRAHLCWQSVVCAPAQLALGRDGSTEPDDRGGGGSHSLFAHYSLTIRSLFAHYPLTIHSLLVLTALQGDSHSLFAHYPLIIRSLFTHYLLCSPSTDYSLTIHSPFDSQCEMHQSGARIRGFNIDITITELHSWTSIKMNLLSRFQGFNYTPIRRGITT